MRASTSRRRAPGGEPEGDVMRRRSMALVTMVLSILAALAAVAPAGANGSTMSIEGTIDVPPFGPGGVLSLPLASGSPPVQVLLTFGQPAVQIPVFIDASAYVQPDPLVLTDGLPVDIYLAIELGQFFKAVSVKQAHPDEVNLRGTVAGLPAGGVSLPVGVGVEGDVTLQLDSSTITVPLRIHAFTSVHPEPLVIANGDVLSVKGAFRDGRVVSSYIEVQQP